MRNEMESRIQNSESTIQNNTHASLIAFNCDNDRKLHSALRIPHSAFQNRARAFTFFEIMIVISIVAILAAITMPRLKSTLAKVRVKSAARKVTGLLRYARTAAILGESTCEVRFDLEKDSYELTLHDKSGEPIKTKTRRSRRKRERSSPVLGDDARGPRFLPKDVHFVMVATAAPLTDGRKGLPRVIYYSDGSATPATISIQDKNERAISVEIYRTTGMTRIEPGLPQEKPKAQTLYYGPKAKRR